MEPVFFWIVAAVLLGVAELFTGTLVLAMVAAGAALAGIAAALGAPFWLQAILFGVGSVASIWGLRPFLRQALESDRGDERPRTFGTRAIEGAEARVIETVDLSGGLVEIAGDNWTAYPLEPDQVLEPGESATVVEIKGATVIVWKQS
ncbi:NfeD family protein [Glycomyces harbinensis]|uniref:Membrane protein implicated in regulation of membrane protease activity n=1 Tax=Glycomyces harbinensis TaxID=58114 RepID=A0A1G6WRZ6_9ACTN|nr:NfeD family protein [Glycomyces harbinensis]SDD68720.1 Membrane protein implicated in regulation of membrane protease activity [Glycomyces harbinensis]